MADTDKLSKKKHDTKRYHIPKTAREKSRLHDKKRNKRNTQPHSVVEDSDSRDRTARKKLRQWCAKQYRLPKIANEKKTTIVRWKTKQQNTKPHSVGKVTDFQDQIEKKKTTTISFKKHHSPETKTKRVTAIESLVADWNHKNSLQTSAKSNRHLHPGFLRHKLLGER